jgi:site-specific DNA-methyltransferase (adenine-specific)
MATAERLAPGVIRDGIIRVLMGASRPLSTKEIEDELASKLGPVAGSSVRSYLQLNTPGTFTRTSRGTYCLAEMADSFREPAADYEGFEHFNVGKAKIFLADCLDWLRVQPPNSLHAVVTDPPYGLFEYSEEQQEKLRSGSGGVWRIPPSFDGSARSPLPRFTTLTQTQIEEIESFFVTWGRLILDKTVPGANVVVASNPLLSHVVAYALSSAGLERRGEIIRLTMTMRGGDRPKDAHEEFADVSVMPRSMWEPWVLFRKPVEGRVQDNLRKWGTGGFRRPAKDRPFGDVIESSPTRATERKLAPHPSLKPQDFMRKLVRGVLPLGSGIVCDPFAGSGSTLAAANAVGYDSIGVEKDRTYFDLAKKSIEKLSQFGTGVL